MVTYTDLSPAPARHGELNFTSETQQGGAVEGLATLWNGPSPSLVNLHPTNTAALFSLLMGGSGNQQVGYTYRESWGGPRAALWSGSAASHVNLNPAWSLHSIAYAATETHQAGYVTTSPNFQVRAGFWSGTAESFVDLHPGGVSSTAYAMAGNQQGGMVNYNGTAQAALWSGTAASHLSLHPLGPLGQFEHSSILGMTTNQQVGYAGGHAALWFGSAGSFRDLHPAGAGFSEARATIDVIQAGYATFDSQPHAILWFGSATNYLDLHPVMGGGYRHSEARSVWTDGSTTLVAGMARTTTGISHAILWRVTALPSPSVSCSAPLILEYTNGVATGVLHAQVEDTNASTVEVVWTVDGIPSRPIPSPREGT